MGVRIHMPPVLVTAIGPVPVHDSVINAYLFESIFFDYRAAASSTSPNTPSLDPARISLGNRWTVLIRPFGFLDNVVGGVEVLEYELRSLTAPIVLCLHNNSLLINGDKFYIEKFQSLAKQYAQQGIHIVLSVSHKDGGLYSSVPPTTQLIDFLVSQILYGKDGLNYGMLGPIEIDANDDEPATVSLVAAYTEAQKRTGAPVVMEIKDWTDATKRIILSSGLSADKLIIFGVFNRTHIDLLIEWFKERSHGGRPCVGLLENQLSSRELGHLMSYCQIMFVDYTVSPGCRFKTDFKVGGGAGLAASRVPLKTDRLQFEWSPPKQMVQQEVPAERWKCDMCKTSATMDEQPNYTKLGFTYCSIKCLADHRKMGFCPL